jgi:hypothetical protein
MATRKRYLAKPALSPSQIVLGSLGADGTRGDLTETLVDIFDEFLEPMAPEEESNGGACDTLLRLLDLIVVTDDHRERLSTFLNERSST